MLLLDVNKSYNYYLNQFDGTESMMLRYAIFALSLPFFSGCAPEEEQGLELTDELGINNDYIEESQVIDRNILLIGSLSKQYDENDFFKVKAKDIKEKIKIKVYQFDDLDVQIDLYNDNQTRINSFNDNYQAENSYEKFSFIAEANTEYYVGIQSLTGNSAYKMLLRAESIKD